MPPPKFHAVPSIHNEKTLAIDEVFSTLIAN